ncbi:MAG: hypothetical protein IJL98_03285 [Lachnospiraceae bacterium]|nr:hypothetical protein [Lachnospiraceae bacterium]
MIQLPLVFSDHMMLQCGKPVRVFGKASADAVCVTLLNAEGETEALTRVPIAEDGSFEAVLPPLKPGLDKTLVITVGGETLSITDVAIGEVWLASGQSNMEYLMNSDAEMPSERDGLAFLSETARRSVRFFDFPEISFPGMEAYFDLSNFGKWRCLEEADIPYFSAVSYYFERRLQKDLDCPVGVIGCNWGGTSSVCWIPEETIRKAGGEMWLTEYKEGLKAIKDPEADKEAFLNNPMNVLSDPASQSPMDAILLPGFSRKRQEEMLQAFPRSEDGSIGPIGPLHPWRPAGLYETMLKPLMPYTLKGFLWYQGCSDVSYADLHAKLLHALIGKWRKDFKDNDLPFLLVQLAPFGWWLGNSGENYPAVRQAQEEAADCTENTWLASIGDAGMYYDIHPKHKRKPGERLALLALKHVYGLEVPADAPRASSVTFDGDTAVIHFQNGDGLHLEDPENAGLTDKEAARFGFSDPDVPESLPASENLNALIRTVPEGCVQAEVLNGTLRVRLTVNGRPVRPEQLSFAWTGWYEINLKNEAGLPAYPFRF